MQARDHSDRRRPRALYVEPFDGGSHRAFTRCVTGGVDADWTVLTLPGRHWKWRMRGAAAHFALDHAAALDAPFDVVLASSFLPLAELKGLVPGLARVPSALYFHENQLAYPVRDEHAGARDQHFGFTQLVSCLAADRCVFNSAYNRDSFLDAAERVLDSMPDAVPGDWILRIRARASVLPVPVELPRCDPADVPPGPARALGPIVLWNHRWEHDKNAAAFFVALAELARRAVPFRVAVCGQRFRAAPPEFEAAHAALGERVVHWGWLDARADYEALLGRAQIAVSTAVHEFFGVAMIEATHAGARPVVPARLAYPELYPSEFRYASDRDLADHLAALCRRWTAGEIDLRGDRGRLTERFSPARLLPAYDALVRELATA